MVTSGRLYFGTQHELHGTATTTTRIQLHLDDDFQFNPNSFPKCNPADISGNITMQQAMQAVRAPRRGRKQRLVVPPACDT